MSIYVKVLADLVTIHQVLALLPGNDEDLYKIARIPSLEEYNTALEDDPPLCARFFRPLTDHEKAYQCGQNAIMGMAVQATPDALPPAVAMQQTICNDIKLPHPRKGIKILTARGTPYPLIPRQKDASSTPKSVANMILSGSYRIWNTAADSQNMISERLKKRKAMHTSDSPPPVKFRVIKQERDTDRAAHDKLTIKVPVKQSHAAPSNAPPKSVTPNVRQLRKTTMDLRKS